MHPKFADAEQAKQCLVDGCGSNTAARSLCNKHYKRWRANGTTETVTRPRGVTLAEAFAWHQTSPEPTDDSCWDWQGRTDDDGYGEFNYGDGRPIRAHRASYLIHVGEIPAEMLVRHTCDRRICVRSSHLIPGTNDDNMRDMVDRERAVRGEGHHNSKLTEVQVREIRELHPGVSMKELGRRFGVSDFTINQVVSRVTWRHFS